MQPPLDLYGDRMTLLNLNSLKTVPKRKQTVVVSKFRFVLCRNISLQSWSLHILSCVVWGNVFNLHMTGLGKECILGRKSLPCHLQSSIFNGNQLAGVHASSLQRGPHHVPLLQRNWQQVTVRKAQIN